MRQKPWWEERILGAYVSYWIYQHLGNLSPDELRAHDLFQQVRGSTEDMAPVLRRWAREARDEVAGTRWSYTRDFGATRLVVLDTRAGRIVPTRPSARCSPTRVGVGQDS